MDSQLIKSILARFMFQEKGVFYNDENTEAFKSPHRYEILLNISQRVSWIHTQVRKSQKNLCVCSRTALFVCNCMLQSSASLIHVLPTRQHTCKAALFFTSQTTGLGCFLFFDQAKHINSPCHLHISKILQLCICRKTM